MDRLKDYNNYDKLVLYVKNNKTQYIIYKYKYLGWELVSSVCNHKYRNIMDLTFVRPHKYKNKDKLHLLQINMEMDINKIAKLEKNKHNLSNALSISLVTIGLGLFIFSIVKLFNSTELLDFIIASVCGIIGALLFIVLYIFIPKIYLKENIKFDKKFKELDLELNHTMAKIEEINTNI